MICKKCNAETDKNSDTCQHCKTKLSTKEISQKGKSSAKELILSILASCISVFLSLLYRLTEQVEVDLDDSAFTYTAGLAVPNNIIPIILCFPLIFTLVNVILTIFTNDMSKEQKYVSYCVSGTSFIISVFIIYFKLEI